MDVMEKERAAVQVGPTYHSEVEQGSDEWLQARCGLLTASEMKLILTPTLKVARNDKQRAHLYELLAQRITSYVEPKYVSDDMLRGHQEEVDAIIKYNEEIAPVDHVGFITNSKWGFTLGYSPDGLVGLDGAVEVKSRRQKFQVQTILEHVLTGSGTIPAEFALQIQTGLLVSERDWMDFISYSGGMPMVVIRVFPDKHMQAAILEAADAFERALHAKREDYRSALQALNARVFETERREYEEIML